MPRHTGPGVWAWLGVIGTVTLVGPWAGPAYAGPAELRIVSQSVEVEDRRVLFRVLFSDRPDFFTLDEFGRPAHSFQYELNANWTGRSGEDPLGELTAVVRGDEIHVARALRVRDAFGPPDPDPAAGGWGALRGVVPFDLDDARLSFEATLDLLGDTDGVFAYRVFSTEFGLTTSLIEGQVVPLPPAAWAGTATIGAWALFGGRGRREFRVR